MLEREAAHYLKRQVGRPTNELREWCHDMESGDKAEKAQTLFLHNQSKCTTYIRALQPKNSQWVT